MEKGVESQSWTDYWTRRTRHWRRRHLHAGAEGRDCQRVMMHERVARTCRSWDLKAWSRGPDETNRVQHETTPTGRSGALRCLAVPGSAEAARREAPDAPGETATVSLPSPLARAARLTSDVFCGTVRPIWPPLFFSSSLLALLSWKTDPLPAACCTISLLRSTGSC